MISKEKYIDLSLELHLFWARIMKEHSIFLEVGFTDKNKKLAKLITISLSLKRYYRM